MFRGEKEESLAPSQTPDSGADEAFTRRLKQCGFRTATVTGRARKPGKRRQAHSLACRKTLIALPLMES
jgi:hypothetical protein